jgi:quercetin dioxygenase-like cupin family protein
VVPLRFGYEALHNVWEHDTTETRDWSDMSDAEQFDAIHRIGASAIADPDAQRAVWFLGALVRERVAGFSTGDALAVLEHTGHRGYNSPMHRHLRDDETFVVLDGKLELTVDGEHHVAEAGAALWLARQSLHGFVVASPGAKFLTLHTPSGFDKFTLEAGAPAHVNEGEREIHQPDSIVPPTPEELTRIAATYGIEIVGPPPAITV